VWSSLLKVKITVLGVPIGKLSARYAEIGTGWITGVDLLLNLLLRITKDERFGTR